MKILHLTDFHYSSVAKNKPEQDKLINSLNKELSLFKDIDAIFFTGDLVFSGEKYNDFIEAKTLLLDSISTTLNISKERVFICPGNHDVFREQELIDTTDKIKEIDTNKKLEDFLKRQEGKSFNESLKNHENYNNFQKEFYQEYGSTNNDVIKDLYTIHRRVIDGKNISIVTINSAWRAIDSNTDRGNLLFPLSVLQEITNEVKNDTDFKILLMHHPISDFKDWNASDMEDLIHKNFHMMFSGHLHKKKQSMEICSDEGIFCCSSAATLSIDGTQNGFSIISIDLETYDIEINNRFYIRQEGLFAQPKEAINTSIPVGEEKSEAILFRKTIRKKYIEALDRANELFISFEGEEVNKGFLNLYTSPILKSKTKAEIAENRVDSPNILLPDLIASNENIVIFGKDKSGKTSVLFKGILDLLKDFTLIKTIPVYINSKDYKNDNKPLDIYKIISTYYETNHNKAKELIEKYSIKLLLDNYEPTYESFNNQISLFLETHKNVSFIATTEERLLASFSSYEFDGRTYKKLYIHEISRLEVRSLANKWPNLTIEKREIILEKIFGIFTQLNIPINYWTVSLFIWIFEKNNDANFHNSFDLIQLYIDNLLDKKSLTIDKSSKIKFEDFKIYLSELSYFLLFERHEKGYTATYSEIVVFTNEYREKNKRFVIEVKDIVDLIIDKNILRRIDDDKFTFRLNGVFEYFIALYLTQNEKFRDGIINDDHFYLSFKNELELYAGFEKTNESFVKKIYDKTKTIFAPLHSSYSTIGVDTQLISLVSEAYDISSQIKKLGVEYPKALTVEQQDQLLGEITPVAMNNSEVTPKNYYEKISDNTENLEKVLFILARVFRNSNIKNYKLQDEILDYILTSACYLGFKMIKEAETDKFGLNIENISPEKEKMLVKLLTNFMPIIVQTFLYDAIGHNDLERIFIEKINELKKDKKNNQFKLLILYFTLIDLDIKSHKDYIEEIIDTIEIGILSQTSILKLYSYLIFKCSTNAVLEKFIKDKIQSLTLKTYPGVNLGLVQKGIETTTKVARLANQKNQQRKKKKRKQKKRK